MKMSGKWTASANSEGGILRKSDLKEKKEELFVFGYSCKLFRDDERALQIDQGKHLIPWMGDESLKIDRYDARGALHDLSGHEAPPGGFDWRVELTRNELDVEQLCDEERYRALHTDEDEEEMYKEEELKRLHAAGYGQVGFNYDAPKEPEPAQPAEVDEPFLPTAAFRALLPSNIILPDSEKQNAIIEKTAKFIATQGAQMEILIKAKQGDNPQFQFLNKECVLNPYYIALIALVKAGKWPEKKVDVVEEKMPENEEYLHPSLASTIIESAPSIPSIHYKPSADCDYTLLISKMRGDPPPEEPYTATLAPGEVAPPGTEPLPPRGGVEIARGPVLYNKGNSVEDEASKAAQAHAAQVYQQQYAAYYHQYMAQTAALQAQVADPPPKPGPCKSTGLSLMKNYNTDSDSDVSDCDDTSSTDSKDKPIIITPPEEIQVVIEKMASYVARNGIEFADIVRSKGDPRFVFLEPNDVHHEYYKARLAKLQIGEDGSKTGNNVKKTKAPVSFSIKKLKEPDPILPKPALPYESSSEEEGEKPEEKQENKTEELKPTTPSLANINNIPTAVVYKMDGTFNNLSTVKTIETIRITPNPPPIVKTVQEAPKEEPKPIILTEKPVPQVEERKKSPTPDIKPEQKIENGKGNERESPKEEKSKNKDRSRSRERSRSRDRRSISKERSSKSRDLRERRSKSKDRSSKSRDLRDRRSKSKDRSSKSRDLSSKTVDKGKVIEREKKKDREVEKAKKSDKDDLESEIISLEDNSDDMIDLTGDQSDSKGEGEIECDRSKQQERRRRAAEFLKKVGVDVGNAPLPTSSLASAMVDTLETLRKKKEEEEEKRRKREKRKHHRDRRYNDHDKTHRKSKRRKYKSSDDEASDYDSSKKRKRKKDKKSTKSKKKRRKEVVSEEEQEQMDHPLPPNVDLTNTLKELRTSSPTKELLSKELPHEEIQRDNQESSDEEVVKRRKRKKKDDKQYSEGEWSSDSKGDSASSKGEDD